jgi:hypothetical protein
MMNHRDMWHPENILRKLEQLKYNCQRKRNYDDFAGFRQETGIDDKMRRQTVKKNV